MINAIARFQALSNETRLKAFRLLVAAGKAGLAAGDIASNLKVPASTLSNHLAILERAGLVQSWRVQRSIFYAVVERGIGEIIEYLTHDCCRGAPELCGFPATKARPAAKAKKSA